MKEGGEGRVEGGRAPRDWAGCSEPRKPALSVGSTGLLWVPGIGKP